MSRMKSALLTIGLAAGSVLAIAAPAAAEASRPPVPSCSDGYFCAWENADYTGRQWNWLGGAADRDWRDNYNDGALAHNRTSSWSNNGVTSVYGVVNLWDNVGDGPPHEKLLCLNRGESVAANSVADNKVSGHSWGPLCF